MRCYRGCVRRGKVCIIYAVFVLRLRLGSCEALRKYCVCVRMIRMAHVVFVRLLEDFRKDNAVVNTGRDCMVGLTGRIESGYLDL